MTRNFGLGTNGTDLGGNKHLSRSPIARYSTPRNSIPLAAQTAHGSSFPRGELSASPPSSLGMPGKKDQASFPPLPSGSILPISAPLERGKVAQALIDICALGICGLLASGFVTALGAVAFVAYLLLVP